MYIADAGEARDTQGVINFNNSISVMSETNQKKAQLSNQNVEAADGVSVEFSREAMELLKTRTEELEAKKAKKEEQLKAKQEAQRQIEAMQEEMERMKESADAAAEGFEELSKILTIARRIMNGDIVPAKDEKKLMEFDNDLYQACKAAAMLKEARERKKYDSLWDDEESVEEKARELEGEAGSDSEAAAKAPTGTTTEVAQEAAPEISMESVKFE